MMLVFLTSTCLHLEAKMSSSMLDSILLINLDELQKISHENNSKQRRSLLSPELIEDSLDQNPVPGLPDTLTSTFEATHAPPH